MASMRIAMIGCGAAGSCFAGYLRKGGADITLVDKYKAHMDKVAEDGLEFIIYPDTHYHLNGIKTAYTADDIGIMDIVIFVTKATQLDAAVMSAMPCIGPDTVVASLINGLGNDEILLRHFPANRILCGSGALGTEQRGPGCGRWHGQFQLIDNAKKIRFTGCGLFQQPFPVQGHIGGE